MHPHSRESPGRPLIKAIEIKPGARAQVHHVIAYTQPSGQPAWPGVSARPRQHRRCDAEQAGMVFPDGVARLLRKGQDIIPQMHYTTNGTAATDRTQVGLVFAKEPPSKLAAGGLAVNLRFVIPPNDGNFEFTRAVEYARAGTRC